MKKTLCLAMVFLMLLCLTACGKDEKPADAPDKEPVTTEALTEAPTETAAEADYNNPSIVVEFGDYDGINKLGKDLQNFAVEEGTVIKVTGLISRDFKDPSINERNSDDTGSMGITMFLDGMDEADYPEDGAKVEVVGITQKGQYFMEFHVTADHLKVLE